MMKYKLLLTPIVFILAFCFCPAQSKNEQETRINKVDFPKSALQLLEHLPKKSKRIKYYKETDNTIITYEAKLKLNKRKYSIEFDEQGHLEDVEITLRKHDLKKEVFETIKEYLGGQYKTFYLLKIQKQYKKEPTDQALSVLNEAISFSYQAKTNFEIIAQVQDEDTSTRLMEFTFSYMGSLIHARTIEPSSYEHVLY